MTDAQFLALCKQICAVLEQGYGDPADSDSGTTSALTGSFTHVLSVSRPAIVILENTGTVNVEWGVKQTLPSGQTGKILIPTAVVTLDRFRGSIYAKGSTGIINWIVMPWNIPIH
jgi:hypothetical protein